MKKNTQALLTVGAISLFSILGTTASAGTDLFNGFHALNSVNSTHQYNKVYSNPDKALFDQYLKDLANASSKTEKDELTNEFFNAVEYSNGFPIIDGNNVTFVFQSNNAYKTPIRVSGDFNDWATASNKMTKANNRYNVYYTTVKVSDGLNAGRYKFVAKDSKTGADVWLADFHARRYEYDAYGEYSIISDGESSSSNHLERFHAFYSEILGNTRDLFLYVPPGYEATTDEYPVIYMHDGQNLFDPLAMWGGWKADDVLSALISRGEVQKVIIVGMANTPDRMDEYTHVEDFLPGYGGMIGGQGPEYADFIVEEVIPFINSKYRVRTERENTAVLGSSLGGLISYYIGYAYPDVFQYVGGMSSTFVWGSINEHNPTMIENLYDESKLPIIYYVDSGGGDGGTPCVDSDNDGIEDDNGTAEDNYCETVQMYNMLKKDKGYTSEELMYVFEPGQDHNEMSWSSRFHYPLKFWFPAK